MHQLPAPPQDFVGRNTELAELLAAFAGDAMGHVAISGVRGMGGVGKTALALVLATQLTPRYPAAQFYLDLRGADPKPLTSADALAHIIRAYQPTDKLPDDLNALQGMYRSVLHGQRALLLMDNAADAAQVRPLLPPTGCALIVTSRQRFTLAGMKPLNLEALPPADARTLLLTLAPHSSAHADEIARLCGYLPLALRAAGSLLAVTEDLSPAHYLMQLRDERTRLERLHSDDVEISVTASLQLSYDKLPAETARVFRYLAVFPAPFDAKAAEAICGEGTQPYVSELVKRSLLEWNKDSERYSWHDLARLFAAGQQSEEEHYASAQRHAEHYLNVLWETDKLYKQGGEAIMRGLALFDAERTHIEIGQVWAAANSIIDGKALHLCNDYPHVGLHCLDLRLHPHVWIRWLENARAAAQRLGDRTSEGWHVGNLGATYTDLGEPHRAIEYYNQVLIITRETGDQRNEGIALSNLGAVYAIWGEIRQAIELYKQHLIIAHEISDRSGEGIALGNLGEAYIALGEIRKAIEFHERALRIDREVGDRRNEATDLGGLGFAYTILGEVHKAIECHKQQLAITREIGDQRGEGNALGNLGLAYAALGETRRALEYYRQHLAIAREVSDKGSESDALHNFGEAYAKLNEHDKALEYYRNALAIREKIEAKRDIAETIFCISISLDKLNERKQAIAHAEAALKIYKAIEDPNAERVRRKLEEWRAEGDNGLTSD